jgi:hypothetical protein
METELPLKGWSNGREAIGQVVALMAGDKEAQKIALAGCLAPSRLSLTAASAV